MIILKVTNLSKKYGKKEILKDVSFEINSGDILAFIGANGSGKTTTIKCILGLAKASSGTVSINNYNIKQDFEKAIAKVGSIVESPDVYMYLSGYENLLLRSSYYQNISPNKLAEVVELVGLEKSIYDPVSKYSLGMRERLGLALALINSPNLLILDEPTNGLDPQGIKELRELLLKLSKTGVGILISSHNLSELETFCNKVCIISHGRIIESSSMAKIKENNHNKYILKTDDTKKLKKIKDITIIDQKYFSTIKSEDQISLFIKELISKDVNLYEVKKENISLEEIFITKEEALND